MSEFRDYELYKRLQELYSRLNETNSKLDDLNTKLGTTNSKLDTLNDTLTTTNRRLTTLLQQDLILWRINQNGDVIFNDTFDGNELHWETETAVGGTVTREYSGTYVYHGNASVKLHMETDVNDKAQIHKYFAVPGDISGVGFEWSFLCPTSQADVRVYASIAYYDGSTLHAADTVWKPDLKVYQVSGTTTLSIYPQVNRSLKTWNKVKLTVDFDNDKFKDVWFNDVGQDASSVALVTSSDSTEPCFKFVVRLENLQVPDAAWDVYLDDFILSINEPKVF